MAIFRAKSDEALPHATAECRVVSPHCATFKLQPQPYIRNEQIVSPLYHSYVHFHRFNKVNNLNEIFFRRDAQQKTLWSEN